MCASRSDGKRIGRLHPVFSLDWLWRARVTPAAAAGVSAQSVHKAFGTKPALLKSVSDVAIAGDDEPVPVPQRAALSRVRVEPDPRRKLRRNGRWVAETLIAALLP